LLRIVVGADGLLRVDPRGRAPGRGAYVHLEPGCVAAALERERIVRALRTGSQAEELGRLESEIVQQMGVR
jgi:predicted RNA-binding protein YlxR (DUF448 family)